MMKKRKTVLIAMALTAAFSSACTILLPIAKILAIPTAKWIIGTNGDEKEKEKQDDGTKKDESHEE